MAKLIDHRNRITISSACVLLGSLLASGCSDSSSPADISGQPFVRVLYQGQPLGDVQVKLHETLEGPALTHSISRQDGNAYFTQVPSPEPSRYFVTVESISDGGWILDSEACQKLSESISLEPLESSRDQRIEIHDNLRRQRDHVERRNRADPLRREALGDCRLTNQ